MPEDQTATFDGTITDDVTVWFTNLLQQKVGNLSLQQKHAISHFFDKMSNREVQPLEEVYPSLRHTTFGEVILQKFESQLEEMLNTLAVSEDERACFGLNWIEDA